MEDTQGVNLLLNTRRIPQPTGQNVLFVQSSNVQDSAVPSGEALKIEYSPMADTTYAGIYLFIENLLGENKLIADGFYTLSFYAKANKEMMIIKKNLIENEK